MIFLFKELSAIVETVVLVYNRYHYSLYFVSYLIIHKNCILIYVAKSQNLYDTCNYFSIKEKKIHYNFNFHCEVVIARRVRVVEQWLLEGKNRVRFSGSSSLHVYFLVISDGYLIYVGKSLSDWSWGSLKTKELFFNCNYGSYSQKLHPRFWFLVKANLVWSVSSV